MKKILIILFILFPIVMTQNTNANSKVEISIDSAIEIASNIAVKTGYKTQDAAIEVLKVKEGQEKGPIRLLWLLQYFSKDNRELLFDNEFWIVYFYPKGKLEESDTLGGDFCVLVELYTGNVLASLEFQ